MNPDVTILAVAGDPGGANALLPVLRMLSDQGLRVAACPYREAITLWANGGIAVTPLSEGTDPAQLLRAARASFLLAATSMNGVDLEKAFIAAARSLRIPSLALLDFWSHYRERFADKSGTLAYLPDRVAVMDELAREQARACGVEADRLVITGQPAFDALREQRQRFTAQARVALRRRLGAGPDDLLVAFLSQPLSETVGNKLGFTESSVLELVARALASIQTRHTARLLLLVRPHPREKADKFQGFMLYGLAHLVSGGGDPHEAVLAADLVVGMNTVLLYEACLMECITLSVQPNISGSDVLPSNRAGWTRAVYNPLQIEPSLEQMLFDQDVRGAIVSRLREITPPGDATRRVVRLIHSTISQGADRP